MILRLSLARYFDTRQPAGKILANIAWLFLGTFWRTGLGALVAIWTARYLGPAQFGILNYAAAFASLFAAFAALGLDNIAVRDIVRETAEKDEILGTVFFLKLAAGALTFLLIVAGVLLIKRGDRLIQAVVAIMAAGTILHAFNAISFWFQSQVESRCTVVAGNVASSIVGGAKIVLVLCSAPLIAFAWAQFGEAVLAAAGLVVAYRSVGLDIFRWHFSLGRARQLLHESWPLVLAGLTIAVYMRIDQLMLGQMVGNEALGVYSAAVRVSEIWYVIPMAVVSSLYPSFVEAKKASEAAYYNRFTFLFCAMSVIAIGVIIPVTLFSTWIMRLLYGVRFLEAGPILAVHIWSGLFVFLGVAQGPWNIIEGYTRLSFQRTLSGAIVNIVLNLWLIPRYAGLGAAVATLVAYFFAGYLANLFDRRTRHIFALQTRAIFLGPLLLLRRLRDAEPH